MIKIGGQHRDIIVALALGFVAAIVVYFYNSEKYLTTLSSLWGVFAVWFPLVIIILALTASNTDKVGRLADDVAICASFILFTTLFLFIHGALNNPPVFWTLICTMATVATVFIFALMSWKIFYQIRRHNV